MLGCHLFANPLLRNRGLSSANRMWFVCCCIPVLLMVACNDGFSEPIEGLVQIEYLEDINEFGSCDVLIDVSGGFEDTTESTHVVVDRDGSEEVTRGFASCSVFGGAAIPEGVEAYLTFQGGENTSSTYELFLQNEISTEAVQRIPASLRVRMLPRVVSVDEQEGGEWGADDRPEACMMEISDQRRNSPVLLRFRSGEERAPTAEEVQRIEESHYGTLFVVEGEVKCSGLLPSAQGKEGLSIDRFSFTLGRTVRLD